MDTVYDPDSYVFVLNEKCYLKTLVACLAVIGLVCADEGVRYSFRKYVTRHSNKIPDEDGCTSVSVRYSTAVFERQAIGRMYPTISSDGVNAETHEDRRCVTFSLMSKRLKSLICIYYHDIDFKNSHPVILFQISEQNNIPCEYLETYVNQRDDILQELSIWYKTTKDAVKQLFIRILYGGGNDWKAEFAITVINDHSFVINFKNEIRAVVNKLLSLKKYKRYVKYAKSQDKTNPFSAISHLLSTKENDCLRWLCRYYMEIGYEIGSLEYDGLKILKKDSNPFPEEHLLAGQRCIFEKTGFNIVLAEKITEPCIWLNTNHTHIVSGNKEAALIVIDGMKDNILFNQLDNNIYYKHKYQWIHLKKYTEFNSYVDKYIFITINGTRRVILSDDIYNDEKICKAMFEKIKGLENLHIRDFQLIVKNSTEGKICFINGIYDFSNKELISWEDDRSKGVYTEVIINDDYTHIVNKEKKDYLWNLLEEQFDEKIFKDVLKITARAIAGHIDDKRWITLFGNRNSGKGVWECLLRAAFGGQYISSTNSENFVLKHSSNDAAKDKNWMVPIRHSRMVITNEIAPRSILNGALIKNFCSGGDLITGREIYCAPISFYHQCTFMICCNDVAKISPVDANNTRVMIEMQNSYVPQSVIDEATEYQRLRLKLAIPNIKSILTNDQEYIDAFRSIIFDYYEPVCPGIPTLDDTSKSFSDGSVNIKEALLERFIIDRKSNDFMTHKEINKILDEIKAVSYIEESIPALKIILKNEGAVEKPSRAGRGLKYIKEREIE